MNYFLCARFIQYLNREDGLSCGHAPEHIKVWLEQLGLPTELLRFMQWEWPQVDCQIGPVAILSSASIYADEATAVLLKYKFLNIGSAPNGDWFAIDFFTDACQPGFVAHEKWSPWSDQPSDPRGFFEPIGRLLDSFLYRVVEDRFVPYDYDVAKDFNRFLADEKAMNRS